jgi:hypothetical protein
VSASLYKQGICEPMGPHTVWSATGLVTVCNLATFRAQQSLTALFACSISRFNFLVRQFRDQILARYELTRDTNNTAMLFHGVDMLFHGVDMLFHGVDRIVWFQVAFEAFTAVAMDSIVAWVVTLFSSETARPFGGIFCFCLQGVSSAFGLLLSLPSFVYFSTLKTEAVCS